MPIKDESDSQLSQRELLRKYAELSTLSQYLKTFDTSVFGKLDQVNDYLDGQTDYRDEQEAAEQMEADMQVAEQVREAAQKNFDFSC